MCTRRSCRQTLANRGKVLGNKNPRRALYPLARPRPWRGEIEERMGKNWQRSYCGDLWAMILFLHVMFLSLLITDFADSYTDWHGVKGRNRLSHNDQPKRKRPFFLNKKYGVSIAALETPENAGYNKNNRVEENVKSGWFASLPWMVDGRRERSFDLCLRHMPWKKFPLVCYKLQPDSHLPSWNLNPHPWKTVGRLFWQGGLHFQAGVRRITPRFCSIGVMQGHQGFRTSRFFLGLLLLHAVYFGIIVPVKRLRSLWLRGAGWQS